MRTYVALSRPPSLAQLMSIGLPEELRSIIEGGPPEGILSRFCDMFKEKEDATHLRAAEVMRELGWDAIEERALLQSARDVMDLLQSTEWRQPQCICYRASLHLLQSVPRVIAFATECHCKVLTHTIATKSNRHFSVPPATPPPAAVGNYRQPMWMHCLRFSLNYFEQFVTT